MGVIEIMRKDNAFIWFSWSDISFWNGWRSCGEFSKSE